MKLFTLGKNFLFVSIAASLLFACKKNTRDIEKQGNFNSANNNRENSKKKPFKGHFESWYRVSPVIPPQSVVINGVNYLGILHFPGGGSGNATHMGNVQTFFNQLAYIDPANPTILVSSVAAALTEISGYPVASDFSNLPGVISRFSIPTAINGRIVNSIIYNNKGDAVFLSSITGTGGSSLTGTVVTFSGDHLIVGGRGKFRNASGEATMNGFYSIVDVNDAGFTLEGWIKY